MEKIKSMLRFFLRLLDNIFFQKGFDEKDTIIVVGSPRSGTTWIMELLNCLPQYTTIFEPFHPIRFPQVKELISSMRPYKAADSDVDSLHDYLYNVFKGNVTSLRPRYRITINNMLKRIIAKKLIIKFVRANRLVPWIVNNYDLRAVVFITRHPCSTISSQIRTGYTGYDVERFAPSIDQVVNDASILGFESSIIEKLGEITSEAEILAAVWAMDQIIPMRENNVKMFKLSYEDLVFYPEQIIKQLLQFLNEMDRYDNIITKVGTPSMTSKDKSSVTVKKVTWKDELNAVQIENIYRVLSWFGISFNDWSYSILDKTYPIFA